MTEQIKSAIDWFEELLTKEGLTESEVKHFQLAIRSIKSWDEVLNELNNIRNHPIANLNQYFIDGIDVATEIIKEKLSEVEECTKAL